MAGVITGRFIYWVDPASWVKGKGHRVSIVVEGERGHYPTGSADKEPWWWGDRQDEARSLELAEQTALEANTRRGFTEEQVMQILMSSMRGQRRVRR